eukprot:6203937-Pleurochrysis_carterae.AAC.3
MQSQIKGSASEQTISGNSRPGRTCLLSDSLELAHHLVGERVLLLARAIEAHERNALLIDADAEAARRACGREQPRGSQQLWLRAPQQGQHGPADHHHQRGRGDALQKREIGRSCTSSSSDERKHEKT